MNRNGISSINNALSELLVTDSIKVGLHEVVSLNRALSTKSTVVLAYNLRRIEALGQGLLILKLSQKLLASIRGISGCGQAQGVQVLDLECLGIIRLARDGDNLVIFVEIEELDLLG